MQRTCRVKDGRLLGLRDGVTSFHCRINSKYDFRAGRKEKGTEIPVKVTMWQEPD